MEKSLFRVTPTADHDGLVAEGAATHEMVGDLVEIIGTVIEKLGALERRVSALEGQD